MFLFAWSLVDSAVKYSRQRRITSILSNYFFSPYSQQTMIICRQITRNLHACSSKALIYRTPSEPNVSQENTEILLYRTEDKEIVAVTQMERIRINEWSLCCATSKDILPPSVSTEKKSKISFIVRLAKIKPGIVELNVKSESNGDAEPSKDEENCEKNEVDQYKSNTMDTCCHLPDFAERIAFRRESPNEVLYECDVENFYNIVFHWSENSLFDFDGRAIVEFIYSIHLPLIDHAEAIKWNIQSLDDVSEEYSGLGLHDKVSVAGSSKSSDIQQPQSLLELLYWRDVLGDFRIKHRGRELRKNGPKYRSDLTLQNSHSKDIRRSLTRNSWSMTQKIDGMFYNDVSLIQTTPRHVRTANSSMRYRSCSPMSFPSKHVDHRAMQIGKNFNIIEDFLANPINTRTLPEWLTTPYFRRLYDPKFNRITYSSMDNGLDKIQIIADKTTNCMRNEFSNEISEKISTPIVIEPSKENWMNDENQESEYFTADKSSPLTEKSLTSPCSTKSLKDEILPIVRIIKEDKQTTPVGSMEPPNVFAKRFSNDFSPANKSSLFQEFSRRRSVSPMILSSMTSPNRHEFMNKLSNGSFRRYNTKLFSRESFSKRTKRFHSIPREVPLSYSSNCKPTYQTHAAQKPPSIFIFTGDDARLFERISHCLNTLLPPNIYTISSLSLTSFLKHSWIDEKPACLFLANTSLLNDIAWGRLQAYFVTGGKIIFLCQNSLLASLSHCESRKMQMNILKNAFGSRAANSSLGKDFERFLKKGLKTLAKHKKVCEKFGAKDLIGGGSYSAILQKKEGQPLLLYMENSQQKASALFSDATTKELLSESGAILISDAISRLGIDVNKGNKPVEFSRGYLIATQDRMLWNMKGITYGEYIGEQPTLYLQPSVVLNGDFDRLPQANSSLLPIEVRRRAEALPMDTFSVEKYYGLLQTQVLGHVLLYVPVCESTMDVSKSFSRSAPETNGVLVVTSCQTKGKGRGGNQWISPPGCAMFTLNMHINLESNLGQCATFVQHIMAVAIVDTVCSLVGDEDFPLRIKWPNDIYFNRKYKMGGILVNASVKNDHLQCTIGAGLNVANSKPTICINDMLTEDAAKLDVESVIAEIMNKFEAYVDMFEQGKRDDFLRQYYKYWLHSDEEIVVDSDGVKEKVVIRGLDSHGFLEVRSIQSRKIFTVHDNGNTFDMMKGLVRAKTN